MQGRLRPGKGSMGGVGGKDLDRETRSVISESGQDQARTGRKRVKTRQCQRARGKGKAEQAGKPVSVHTTANSSTK